MHTLYHIDWVYSLDSKDYKIETKVSEILTRDLSSIHLDI